MNNSKTEAIIKRATKSWNSMTNNQKKTIMYMIKNYNKDDPPDKTYTYSIYELCAFCGIKTNDVKATTESIKYDLKKLLTPFYVVYGKDDAELVAWLSGAYIDEKNKSINVLFHKKILPFINKLMSKA